MTLLTRTPHRQRHTPRAPRVIVSDASPPPVRVTDEERESFDRLGFASIARPIATPEAMASVERVLLAELEQSLIDRTFRDLASGTPTKPQIHEFPYAARREPSLLRSQLFGALQQVAAGILNVERVRLHFDHVILKPDHNGASTSWHQDIAFDPDTDGPMATIWIPFRAVERSSGCMRFIGESNHHGVRKHERSGHDGMGLVDETDLGEPTYCALPAGGVTVHASRTLHGSGPNDSDLPRLAWITKFVPEERSKPRAAVSDFYRQAKYAWQYR